MKINTYACDPVRKKPYTVPINLQDTLDKLIQEMVDLDVIEPSIGEFSSPVVLVKKKTSQLDSVWTIAN